MHDNKAKHKNSAEQCQRWSVLHHSISNYDQNSELKGGITQKILLSE